jgi:hypothetical protein
MKLQIKNFILIAMIALVTIGGTTSCSSKKKLAKKEYEAKLLQAKTDLNAIIEGTTQWTLEEQKSRIDEIEKSDLQNAEIDELIVKAKEVVERKIAEAERVAEEERLRQIEEQNKIKQVTSLEDYFTIIAAAPDADAANAKIAEALKLFASPDVPVLIIVYHVGDIIDYDAPTTAEKYLNYIKDQKKVAVGIHNIKYDNNNKITELELIKK